jgi:hypothetical protein
VLVGLNNLVNVLRKQGVLAFAFLEVAFAAALLGTGWGLLEKIVIG